MGSPSSQGHPARGETGAPDNEYTNGGGRVDQMNLPLDRVNLREGPMPRVLIVEDRKRLLRSLSAGLGEEGFEVLAAPTGEEGYYLATTRDPDVVVLDVMLPGRDGFE